MRDLLCLEEQVLPALTKVPLSTGGVKGETVRTEVRLDGPSRTVEVEYRQVVVKEAQMQLQTRKAKYLSLANEVRAKLADASGSQHQPSQKSTAAAKSDMHLVNDKDEVLNEEGLPFYEPVERISEEEATREKKAYMQPLYEALMMRLRRTRRKEAVDGGYAAQVGGGREG